ASCKSSKFSKGCLEQVASAIHDECSKTPPKIRLNSFAENELICSIVNVFRSIFAFIRCNGWYQRLPNMKLVSHNYGKAHVRVLKVQRDGHVHHLKELDVQVILQGDFE